VEPARAPEVVAMLEQHHDACFAWALACCRYRRADAEDVLQQAYLRILDGSARFAERSAPRTFLFGVIRRCAQEQRRRAAVRAALTGRIIGDLLARLAGSDREPQEAAVRRALRALSTRQREVLELVAYHDLTIEQAGAVLGISIGSARTHYERGKRRLAALLEVTP
jgi:RNA polymerase sigma-70 factor (ECF subfamily)